MINKTYYINLDHRTDRREYFLKNFCKEIKAERISAVYGEELKIENLNENIITLEGKEDSINKEKPIYPFLTKGAIGCALSHKNIWEKILKEKYERTLILEDDINIVENFKQKLYLILEKYNEFDIHYLGHHHVSGGAYKIDSQEILRRPKIIYGTFGYVVNNKAAEELLKIFPITHQIDYEMRRAYKNLKVAVIRKKLVLSEQSKVSKMGTDIQIRN